MKIAAAILAALCIAACGHVAAAERMIEKQIVVDAPIADVWKSWTTREGVKAFFAPDARIEPRPGGLFEIHMNPYAEPGMRGADDMRFLALQEPNMLSFTWNAPPSLPEVRTQRTVVIVRLRELAPAQTQVSLTHVGWGEGEKWDAAHAYFDRAWGNVLSNLRKRYVDGPIDFKPFLERLKAPSADKK